MSTTYFLPHNKARVAKEKLKINHTIPKPKDTKMNMKKATQPRGTQGKFPSQTEEAESSNLQPPNEGTTKGVE
jgi:hypothetical protein